MPTQCSWTFRDAKNQTARVTAFLSAGGTTAQYGAAAETIKADLQALSNAHVTTNADGPLAAVSGGTGDYQDVEDKAEIVFQSASGSVHRYQIPAPLKSIFLPDQETVDFGNAAVGTFVTDVLGNFESRDGTVMNSAIGGFRLRRRNQRRFNIRTRNPLLTGQGL